MTTRHNRTLTALLTTITLAALPATNALANSNWRGMHHLNHAHCVSGRYVLGDNWGTTRNDTCGRATPLHHVTYSGSWK